MLLNILVIFCIIGLSYVFKMNEKLNFDSQILFILLCITIIVIYKFMIVKHKTNDYINTNTNTNTNTNNSNNSNNNNNANANIEENFYNLNDVVDQFSKGTNAQLNNTDIQSSQTATNSEISKLIKKVENLEEEISVLKEPENTEIESKTTLEKQNNEINNEMNYMEKELKNIQNLIYQNTTQENQTNFKKIPVYNSCILNASGELEKDEKDEKAIAYAMEEKNQNNDPNSNNQLNELVEHIKKNGLQLNIQK